MKSMLGTMLLIFMASIGVQAENAMGDVIRDHRGSPPSIQRGTTQDTRGKSRPENFTDHRSRKGGNTTDHRGSSQGIDPFRQWMFVPKDQSRRVGQRGQPPIRQKPIRYQPRHLYRSSRQGVPWTVYLIALIARHTRVERTIKYAVP